MARKNAMKRGSESTIDDDLLYKKLHPAKVNGNALS
jgi:hypothetical protein